SAGINLLFKPFKLFQPFNPPPSSSPATRRDAGEEQRWGLERSEAIERIEPLLRIALLQYSNTRVPVVPPVMVPISDQALFPEPQFPPAQPAARSAPFRQSLYARRHSRSPFHRLLARR